MKPLEREIRALIEKYPLASLATITDEGHPWARYVLLYVGRRLKLYIPSWKDTRKDSHIRSHPDVHITCGSGKPSSTDPYLQIQGRARLSPHILHRHRAWDPSLNQTLKGPNDSHGEVIVITPYRIEYRIHHHQMKVWKAPARSLRFTRQNHSG